MLELAWPVDVGLGYGHGYGRRRIEERTQRRTEPLRRMADPNWATVLAVIGERIIWWLSAVVRTPTGVGGRWSDTRRGSGRGRVGTGDQVRIEVGGVTEGRGGGWNARWMRGAGSLDRLDHRLAADTCFVGGDGVSVQTAAQGLDATANRQTLRNRELGQLCQTQKWLKRYKTGMFANLANLAKQIRKKWGPEAVGRSIDGPKSGRSNLSRTNAATTRRSFRAKVRRRFNPSVAMHSSVLQFPSWPQRRRRTELMSPGSNRLLFPLLKAQDQAPSCCSLDNAGGLGRLCNIRAASLCCSTLSISVRR